MDKKLDFEESGIATLARRSCASLMVRRAAEAGIFDRQEAFDMHIDSAKELGLMPDYFPVVRKTMQRMGFIMQSTRLEGIPAAEALGALNELCGNAAVFIHVSDYGHTGGNMLAFRKAEGESFRIVHKLPTANYLRSHNTLHVWIRWDDGRDLSPFPRREAKSRVIARKTRRSYEDTERFVRYQPNPRSNNIGDCVVRAVSAVLNIPWTDAVDRLAEKNETTINAREVFRSVLAEEGFVHHSADMLGKRRITGADFCQIMDERLHNGEKVFIEYGKDHAASAVPVRNADGGRTYRIKDSWDSTKRRVTEFWVGPPEQKAKKPEPEAENRPWQVGDVLLHKAFGRGTITAISSGILTVDFGGEAHKRLGAEWAEKNCKRE